MSENIIKRYHTFGISSNVVGVNADDELLSKIQELTKEISEKVNEYIDPLRRVTIIEFIGGMNVVVTEISNKGFHITVSQSVIFDINYIDQSSDLGF